MVINKEAIAVNMREQKVHGAHELDKQTSYSRMQTFLFG